MLKYIHKYVVLMLLLSSILAVEVYPESRNDSAQIDNNLEAIKYQCSYLEKNKIFSYKLAQEKIPDDDLKVPIPAEDQTLFFSFCDDSNIEGNNLSEEDTRGSALLRDSDNYCVRITSDKWTDAKISYQNSKNGRDLDYLRLSWNGLDHGKFGENDQNWKFDIDIVCVKQDYSYFSFNYEGGYDDTCRIKAAIENKIGCAVVDFNAIWEFFEENQIIFAIVLIVIGLFLNIAGYRIFIVTLFLTGVLLTMIGVTLIFYLFILEKNTKVYIGWIVLAGSFVVGIFVGLILAKYRKIGIFFITFGAGACLGLMLNNTVVRYTESQALFWVIIVACAVGLGIASGFLFIIAAILSTSFVGAYMAVRGVSIFIGGFPNELTVIEQIKQGILPKTEWQVWVYVIVILIMFVLGFIFQWRFRPEKKSSRSRLIRENDEYFRA